MIDLAMTQESVHMLLMCFAVIALLALTSGRFAHSTFGTTWDSPTLHWCSLLMHGLAESQKGAKSQQSAVKIAFVSTNNSAAVC